MSGHLQLPFGFDARAALSCEDFLIAPCNREAAEWISRWPDWPSPALCIHGPSGCGKTHLALTFMEKSASMAISFESLGKTPPPDILGERPACVLEDADSMPDEGGERQLLHLYNFVKETGRHLLLTASKPPSRWGIGLPDLHSRLVCAPSIAIGPPDDALMAALVVKLFADRQLKIESEVLDYMLERMERSFGAARSLVLAIDEAALANRRNVTVPLVGQVLRGLAKDSQP